MKMKWEWNNKQHRLEGNVYWAELGKIKPLLLFVGPGKLM
jgi:hypothetical protein